MESAATLLSKIAVLLPCERQFSRAVGEEFNVFYILGMARYEARTHTPFLGSLLSPDGGHGLGNLFLRLFLDRVGLKISLQGLTVQLERPIGHVTEDSGGRLDLAIGPKNGRPLIIIENKIDAADQDRQLVRYRNTFENAQILYLTLDGRGPTTPIENSSQWLTLISYRDHIVPWLEDCRKESVASPVVRETLFQYERLIRQLTGQSSSRMEANIVNLATQSGDALEAYFELINSKAAVIGNIMGRLKEQCCAIAKDLGLDVVFRPEGSKMLDGPQATISFSHPSWSGRGVSIDFQFGAKSHANFQFGISQTYPHPQPLASGFALCRFREQFPGDPSLREVNWWPALVTWIPKFGAKEYAQILSGEMASTIRERVQKALPIVQEALAHA